MQKMRSVNILKSNVIPIRYIFEVVTIFKTKTRLCQSCTESLDISYVYVVLKQVKICIINIKIIHIN
jgi:hypothetical protein